ncbi:MAG: zapA [Bacillales bacterium]|nr:zapA [Bacillales bacterium]
MSTNPIRHKLNFMTGASPLKSEKIKITVDIYGQQYTIVGSESTSHIRYVANQIDEKMREIQQANRMLDTTNVAVLTAVNIMHENVLLQEQLEVLERKLALLEG